MKAAPTRTVAVELRYRRVRGWPTYRVTERTEKGGYCSNTFLVSRREEANHYARTTARQLGLQVTTKPEENP